MKIYFRFVSIITISLSAITTYAIDDPFDRLNLLQMKYCGALGFSVGTLSAAAARYSTGCSSDLDKFVLPCLVTLSGAYGLAHKSAYEQEKVHYLAGNNRRNVRWVKKIEQALFINGFVVGVWASNAINNTCNFGRSMPVLFGLAGTPLIHYVLYEQLVPEEAAPANAVTPRASLNVPVLNSPLLLGAPPAA